MFHGIYRINALTTDQFLHVFVTTPFVWEYMHKIFDSIFMLDLWELVKILYCLLSTQLLDGVW